MNAKVYVGGTFDLFHPGHVELLRRAEKIGKVWVALNSDDYAEQLKGKRPIMNYSERCAVLLSCEYVETVVCNDGNEAELFQCVRPDKIIYGNDGSWTRESYLALFGLNEEKLDKLGVELLFLPRTEGVSSSDIVERILQRHRSQPRQPAGAPENAGEFDVSDAEAGRDVGSCLGGAEPCACRDGGGLSSRAFPCVRGSERLGAREACGGPCPCQ